MTVTNKEKNYYSKSALPISGRLKVKCKVTSLKGESIEHGQSGSVNVRNTINYMLENAFIQCAFGHFERFGTWSRYYKDSNTLVEDIGDDIHIKVLSYKMEYPKFEGSRKLKTIRVKGKTYYQTYKKKNGKYVFDKRIKQKGLLKETRSQLK